MEKLIELLEGIRPDLDFENETSLVDGGILDSFDIISIVEAIREEFNVEIDLMDLLPENFNSAEALYKLVQRLKG